MATAASSSGAAGGGKSDRSALDEQKAINEEFKLWKRNTPFLYDLLAIHALEWPSLTVQFLPERARAGGADGQDEYDVQRLMLGTHTSDGEGNYILIAETRLPVSETLSPDGGYGGVYGKLEVVQAINHSGEVNRARCMPWNSQWIASKGNGADVLLFDRTQHVNKPNRNSQCKPEYRLTGHDKEGYGLSWSHLRDGYLLSGSEDGLVCLWDVSGSTAKREAGSDSSSSGLHVPALATFKGHTDNVEDVAWHSANPHLFASASDDKQLMLWDTRSKPSTPVQTAIPHTAEINSLAFNPHSPNLLLSGSADHTLALLDVRQLSTKLHSFEHHTDQVFACHWSPFDASIFVSGSGDRRCCVWDVKRIGEEQSPEEAEDGPGELVFVHGGHTDKISDVSWMGAGERPDSWQWEQSDKFMIASVADDNILQVWEPAEPVFATPFEAALELDLPPEVGQRKLRVTQK